QVYSEAHYAAVCERFGDPAALDRYDTVFIDSITVAGRLCFQWCKGQPEAFSEKTGKPDVRGAYGLHGREMIAWLTHLQHTRAKNVWFVGILDEKLDDFNRRIFQPQIDGSKTGLELPGIVDEVLTMAEIKDDAGAPYRAFICQTINQWNFPAKDRSGRLDLIEEPHLGRLMAKIRGPVKPASERLDYRSPPPAATAPTPDASTHSENI
ncbi:MAG: ATP-binding protein, partial [Bauldia sp.]|nr:ATP-binding protein [Bauldia sp.]